jgi:hypothetical protein
MKIKSVTIEPLSGKHYGTEVFVKVFDQFGFSNDISISISGYYPAPSQREIDNGWEPDEGMDHVETEAEHVIALIIKEALEKWIKNERYRCL